MLDANVPVPSGLKHPQFIATPLTSDVAELDYAAYMASPDVIRVHSDGRWPIDGFTLSDDLKLVAKHQADHESHRAFAFVMLAPSKSEALGCLYMNPLREYLSRVQADQHVIDALPPASAMITFWLRQDQQNTGLAEVLVEAVNDWLLNDWPLAMHLFRVLPDERSSRMALEHLDLKQTRLKLPGEVRPYLWYQPGSKTGPEMSAHRQHVRASARPPHLGSGARVYTNDLVWGPVGALRGVCRSSTGEVRTGASTRRKRSTAQTARSAVAAARGSSVGAEAESLGDRTPLSFNGSH